MNYKEFNDNISERDVSKVTTMSYMFFEASSFNQDVSGWDVSNVTNMSCMFYGASSLSEDVVIDVAGSPPTMNSNPKITKWRILSSNDIAAHHKIFLICNVWCFRCTSVHVTQL